MFPEEDILKALRNDIEVLNSHLDEFKVLEKYAPEVASRLGFAGYLTYATLNQFGNERYKQLDELSDTLEKITKLLAKR